MSKGIDRAVARQSALPGAGPGVAVGPARWLAAVVAWSMTFLTASACSPIVRPAGFRGAREQSTGTGLPGPFDGQVVDAATGEPLQGAKLVGVWSYDGGDGFTTPLATETATAETDQAGRYRLPAAPLAVRDRFARLTAFHLHVYKRGYAGYRSDLNDDGSPRNDFTLRRNRVELHKWQERHLHADHLRTIASPPELAKAARWEESLANVELYRRLGGVALTTEVAQPTEQAPAIELLDAGPLLPPEEIRLRTGYTDAFKVEDLGDLRRTHFYHGVHLEATGREEPWDVAYRVWKDPPGGIDAVVLETFAATLPGVKPTSEVTPETWLLETEDVRAVAFVDRETNVGVLLTCGGAQCVDLETAIILAKYLHGNLDRLRTVAAPSLDQRPAAPATAPKEPSP